LNYVKGFDLVNADVSLGGGSDLASLFDGPGDDRLQAGESLVELDLNASPGASDTNLAARGFGEVRIYAQMGGNDTAILTGSAGNDRFIGRVSYGRMKGDGGLG